MEVHPVRDRAVVAVVHQVHTIPLSKALANLEAPVKDRVRATDKVRVESLETVRAKVKAKGKARRAVENAPLATVQVWVQAPVLTKVDKAKEKVQIREMALARAENRAKALEAVKVQAKVVVKAKAKDKAMATVKEMVAKAKVVEPKL